MTVVAFPKRKRRPLPDDAYPVGRERCILIAPTPDGWTVQETDDGGAMWLGDGLSKEQAIAIGLKWVRECHCELSLSNDCAYEDYPYERELESESDLRGSS